MLKWAGTHQVSRPFVSLFASKCKKIYGAKQFNFRWFSFRRNDKTIARLAPAMVFHKVLTENSEFKADKSLIYTPVTQSFFVY